MSNTSNRKYRYLVEGQCEEKLLNAMKISPSMIHPGKVDVFNLIQDILPVHTLMKYEKGTNVVLVFDTDTGETEALKKNIERLKSLSFKVVVLTIPQGKNFEGEIERTTDVKRAQDLTKSESVREFKSAVVRMKETEFRNLIKRHKFDISKLWNQKPTKTYSFVNQDSEKVKIQK